MLVKQANKAFTEGNYKEALELYKKVQRAYPEIAKLFDFNIQLCSYKISEKDFESLATINYVTAEENINEPWIYYCIPLMNRLEDIKSTLKCNLEIIKPFNKVSMIVNIFDKDNEAFQWIHENFHEDIKCGSLLVNRLEPLVFWHFSIAKNSFKDFIGDEGVYSSLDGDNYLTVDDVVRTKQLFSEFGPSIIHHFSGSWGDGTSGRVSVPVSYYKKYGYRTELLPRQYDEMSLMLNIISAEKNIPFICRSGADIFSKSSLLKQFIRDENWAPNIINSNLGQIKAPENPKSSDYVSRDEKLELYTRINSTFSLLKLAKSKQSIDALSSSLKKALKDATLSNVFLEIAKNVTINTEKNSTLELSGKITLYSVVKNDDVFLPSWLQHYRKLGVERFIIVDDGSENPLAKKNLGNDVHIFKPAVGDFKNFKVFWLMSLMRQFQRIGSLCICTDADEYIDIPQAPQGKNYETTSKLVWLFENSATIHKYGRIPGLLIDLMPEDAIVDVNDTNFLKTMRYHASVDPEEVRCQTYLNHPSIKWAFNDLWRLSYRYDFRYHIYGTFDCLRKIPLFIYTHSIELNQGFHDLIREGRSESLQPSDEILPIRHYKMFKVINRSNSDKLEDFSNYFDRTAKNLEKIYAIDITNIFQKWLKIKKQEYDFEYMQLSNTKGWIK